MMMMRGHLLRWCHGDSGGGDDDDIELDSDGQLARRWHFFFPFDITISTCYRCVNQ
uniref:Uncharacterized protein n=1 Tax=Oryza sativa subsp. japonica TaxID=39947 RepID=Q5Z6K8_ORYSJ|nr:hypothetical protein [Oryza sativa Japonica Group]